jgi:hypothetical protein
VAKAARLPINIPKEKGGVAAREPDLPLLSEGNCKFLLGVTGLVCAQSSNPVGFKQLLRELVARVLFGSFRRSARDSNWRTRGAHASVRPPAIHAPPWLDETVLFFLIKGRIRRYHVSPSVA